MIKSFTLLILLLAASRCLAADTAAAVYDGPEYIDLFDLFNDGVVYVQGEKLVYGSKSTPTELTNVTDLACSTAQRKCILGADFIFKEYTLDPSVRELKNSKIYKVRDQSQFRIYSKVAFIEGTEYFLASSLSKYGVNRFKLGKDDNFAQLMFKEMSDTLECIDLLVIPKSKYALVSFSGYHKLMLIDFIDMTEVRAIAGRAGFLAHLTADISEGYFVSAVENHITKYKLTDGTKVATLMTDYVVTGVRNVENTDFVIVATWEQVFVFNFAGSDPVVWNTNPYYYRTLGKQMTAGVLWKQAEATMYFAGLGHITSLTGTTATFCHPFCNGCSLMLSESKCTACASPAVMENSKCSLPVAQIKLPPGGLIDNATASWSEDNMKKSTPSGFNIKDYYLYIIIGAGGLVGLCCIFCICKMCCKNDENKQNNRVGQRNKDY